MEYVKDAAITWDVAETLEQWVIRMIEEKKTKTPEFESALAYWGRPKFEEIWKKHQEQRKAGKGEK